MQPTIQKGHMRQIGDEIAKRYGVTFKELISGCRKKHIAEARYDLYYNLVARTERSYPAIGAFCNRDHSTVIHGIGRFMERYNLPHPRTGAVAVPKGNGKLKLISVAGEGLESPRFKRPWREMASRDKKILVMFYHSKGMKQAEIAAALSVGREGRPVTELAVRGQMRKLRSAGVLSQTRRVQKEAERAMSEEDLQRHKAKISAIAELDALNRYYPNGVEYSGNRASLNRSPALVPSFQHLWDRRLQFPVQIETQQALGGVHGQA